MNKRDRSGVPEAFLAMLLALVLALGIGTQIPSVSAAPPPAPETIATVFDTAVGANTNVFAPITPTANRGSVAYRLTIALTASNSVVNVQVNDGSTIGAFDLNDGTILTVGRLYTFVWGANSAFSYTLQYETATTTGYLLLEEIKDGVL